MNAAEPSVSAVVLAYGAEPWLEKSVYALLGSTGVAVEVVLVDNGCTDGAVGRLADTPGVAVAGDGVNLGFSGGCNLGAATATGEYLALVNGDLIVEPDALMRLVAVASAPDVGIGAGSLIHTAAVALGIGALLAGLPAALRLVRIAGAGYLSFLALRCLIRAARGVEPSNAPAPVTGSTAFTQGFVTNVTNVKVLLF